MLGDIRQQAINWADVDQDHWGTPCDNDTYMWAMGAYQFSVFGTKIGHYRQTSDIWGTKSQNFFTSHLAVVFVQSIEARC